MRHNEGAKEQNPVLQKGHIAICPKTQKNLARNNTLQPLALVVQG